MSISVKINLAALKNAAVIKSGKNKDVDCIIIPIAQNHLVRGEKGGVYLDMTGFELKNPKADSKDTHVVKQSLPKEVYEKQTDEEKKAMPIIGNMVNWDGASGSRTEAAPVVASNEDDLPF